MRWLARSVLRNEARRWGDKSTAGVDDFNSFSKVFNYARLENITTCPDVEARSHEFDFVMDRISCAKSTDSSIEMLMGMTR
jgi:hypothetical protein